MTGGHSNQTMSTQAEINAKQEEILKAAIHGKGPLADLLQFDTTYGRD